MRSAEYARVKGRLVESPEITTSESGNKYFKVGLAVNRRVKNVDGDEEEVTTFYNILVFGKMVDYYKNLEKGEFVCIEGSLSLKPYLSKEGEAKIDATIIADEVLPIKYIPSDGEKEKTVEDANQNE